MLLAYGRDGSGSSSKILHTNPDSDSITKLAGSIIQVEVPIGSMVVPFCGSYSGS